MADDGSEPRRGNPIGWVITVGGAALQMLGLSGIADSIVEWRGFFASGVMQHYDNLVQAMVGGPVAPVVEIAVGYAVTCVGFFVAALQTMHEHRNYLRRFKVPDDYIPAESPTPGEDGLEKLEKWAHARSRGGYTRLLSLSLVWPLFLLWAIYVWVFVPRRKRLAARLSEREWQDVLESGFDYRRAAQNEALSFLKWSILAILAFVAVLFVSSDLLQARSSISG